MEFIEDEEEIDEDCIEIRRIIDSEAFEGTDSLIQYFWEIRISSINIMQNRNFSIEQRLNILKEFYMTLEKFKDEEDFDGIEETIEDFGDEEVYGQFKGEDFEEDIELYIKLAEDDLCNKIRSVRFKKFLPKYKNEILDENNFIHTGGLEEYEYIFENYIVNNIFKGVIPFNKATLTESLNELIDTYRIIKAYIIGIKNNDDNFNENIIIEIIQAFSKDNEHNNVFKDILKNK